MIAALRMWATKVLLLILPWRYGCVVVAILLFYHCEMSLAIPVKSLNLTMFYEQIKSFRRSNSTSAKAYVLAIARIAAALEFRSSAQDEIKCMLQLLGPMMDAIAGDKLLLNDLREVDSYLKSIDNSLKNFFHMSSCKFSPLVVTSKLPKFCPNC